MRCQGGGVLVTRYLWDCEGIEYCTPNATTCAATDQFHILKSFCRIGFPHTLAGAHLQDQLGDSRFIREHFVNAFCYTTK